MTEKNGRSVPNEREYWVYDDQQEYYRALDALGDILKQMYATVEISLEKDFEFEERQDDNLVLDGLHLARRVLVCLAQKFEPIQRQMVQVSAGE